MISYQGEKEGTYRKPPTKMVIPKPTKWPMAPNVGAGRTSAGMDMNEKLFRQRQQAERDRLNKLYGERLNAQYQAWFNQWRNKQNAVTAGRLYGQLNQFQSYVPPEESQPYNGGGGGYGNQYGWDYGGGGGGSYQPQPPEWYLQSVVWKI